MEGRGPGEEGRGPGEEGRGPGEEGRGPGEEGQTRMLGLLRTSEGTGVNDVKVIKGYNRMRKW